MHKNFLVTGTSLAALGVVLGAFGAHGLKTILPAESINIFETGVRYEMYHSFALLLTAVVYERFRTKWIRLAGYAFLMGIIFFSGSLYTITMLKAAGRAVPVVVGIVTPIGGLFFIAGWISLVIAFSARNHSSLKPV